ncbi:hypothetical protein SARC_08296 [Sphaeroforma arctica JP610]|uniref:Palmitoyltransferase n=1 Tax=Sphaeroforma arctica JP610 TaxID=667725 RepID=A0A0L0FTQ4_9EUKA|nr:hypothetical protein SARC_08296 [Sphaeroforma arctica JP610]KNC79313.1 hypothetical protein SARC_08296 [Sphaeroforma arctica JP610]|eukprot:XP_014153215.1 hypothetical protein SARC_08296 [Sphaeroforma arctica JP610]
MKKVAFSSLSDESKKVILGSRPDGGQGQEQVQAGDEGQAQSMPQAGPSSSVGDEDQAHTGIDTEAQTEATQPETSWETRTSSLARTTLKFEDAPPVLTEKTECTHSMEGTSEPSATNKACLERSAATDTPIKHTGTPTEVESTGVSAPNTQIMSHDIPVALDANSAHPPPAMVAPLSTPLSGDILRSASSAPIDMDDIENLETKVTFRIPASEMKLDERGMLMYLKNDDNVHCPVRTITAERGGGVRLCRIEKLVKPDRTHHCSICRRCILRYDHHCPWIHNCVGFHNHKYFYLFLLYMFLICWWVFGTTLPYTIEWFTSGNLSDTKGGTYPISLSLTIIGAIFGIMVTGLFFFHTYLICVNKTTVEQNFAPNFTVSSKRSNVFNLGVYNNWKYIMGDKVWLWFLPLDGGRSGDGLAYPLPESKELA